MTFSLEQAAIQRARSALDVAATGAAPDAKRKAFVQLAFALLSCEERNEHQDRIKALAATNSLIERAVSHDLASPEWGGAAGELAAAYVASISELSLLDAIARHARILPNAGGFRVLVASGAVGDVVAEGDPVAVKNLNLSLSDLESTRSAALVVLSQELVRAGGPAVMALFERELMSAVARASNSAVVSQMIDSNTKSIDTTGDPLGDLRIGLAAAGPSTGYVVAAPATAVRDLATRVENRGGMSIQGGTFVPGVDLVGIDGATDMVVVPASRLALWDGGVRLRSAIHATVSMAASPSMPADLVSLWQAGLLGLAVDRYWHLAGDTSGVVVVSGETS